MRSGLPTCRSLLRGVKLRVVHHIAKLQARRFEAEIQIVWTYSMCWGLIYERLNLPYQSLLYIYYLFKVIMLFIYFTLNIHLFSLWKTVHRVLEYWLLAYSIFWNSWIYLFFLCSTKRFSSPLQLVWLLWEIWEILLKSVGNRSLGTILHYWQVFFSARV